MKRTKLIKDTLHSVIPEGTAGEWSVGFSGHTDNTDFFDYPEFEITAIRTVADQTEPVSGDPVMNDVYVDYTYVSGTTMSGTTSIYTY